MAEGPAKTKRTGSVVGSLASVDSKSKARSYPLWPEYNENDINAEKWEGSAKGKEKGKSPNMQFFDDPEGRIELPASLKVDHWKRPQDFIAGKIPVIVDNENHFNLMKTNEHLCHSELLRTIISQITILWDVSRKKPSKPENVEVNPWCPWEHIYSLCKAGKGHIPLYNQFGKYIVRLYWMGMWRKIVVDDLMPFDMDGKLMLPSTSCDCELWPMLLAKALIKVATIDYNTITDGPETGDFYVIQCLTGWIPETIPLQLTHNNNVWELMKKILPEWTLPSIDEKPTPADAVSASTATPKPADLGKPDNGVGSVKTDKHEKGSGKDGKAGKESSRKREEKEKSKSRPHTPRPASAKSGTDKSVTDEPVPTRPEDVQMLMFATFSQQQTTLAPMTLLREMAASSEQLRKVGLSHLHTHPVFISQTRSCSLTPPPPVVEVPRWKLIRPHKKKTPPSDEPIPEPTPPKPDQWLELMSPFIGYRPPLNVVDKPASAVMSGGSMALNEIEEEAEEGGEKVVQLKPTSTKSQKRLENLRKGSESQSSQMMASPAAVKGDAIDDVSNKLEEEEENLPEEEAEAVTVIPPVEEELLKKSWVDFDDFCTSFTYVTIFHKPHTYPHNETTHEFKQAVLSAGVATPPHGGKKGSAQANPASSSTNVTKSPQSPVVPKSYEGYSFEERSPGFLFVDSVKESELIVSFSVLPRWLGLEDKRISDRESLAGASEAVSYKPEPTVIPSGLLVVEQYTWKNLVTGQPVLRIKTTGTKSACLTLPPGRHVLRFVYSSPLGYHVHICSTTKFIFGDEDAIMLPLKDESCRFIESSNSIMNWLDKCLETFGSEEEFAAASKELKNAHMPYIAEDKQQLIQHYQSWHNALYATVIAALGETKINALLFGLRTFMLDLQPDLITPGPTEGVKEVVESWLDRSATEEEQCAAELIQRNWKGTYTRKVFRARNLPNSNEQRIALEVLKGVRTALQVNLQAFGLMLLRNLLKNNRKLVSKFPFYRDEWNRISYTDYMGTFSEQPPRTWFVVFREILYVEQDCFCVPRVYVPIPTCMLRVINNDTGEELKKVFQKVAPQWYKKNKRGYTFVAEARTLDQPLTAGKWKLRLIGSTHPLPSPTNSQLTSVFTVKEIKDYYIPNKDHILLRYTLKCNTSLVGSLLLQTSKPEAVILFKIYDNAEEMASAKGKGHCVIPAFYFLTNNKERATSGNSNSDSKGAAPQSKGAGKKVTLSGKKNDGKTSPPATKKPEVFEVPAVEDDDNTYSHSYIIEAKIERKTWPLTRGQWAYVEKLKENEKEELKAFSEEKSDPHLAVHSGRRSRMVKSPTLKRSQNHRKSASSPRSHPHSNISNRDRPHYSGGQRQSLTQKQGTAGDKGKRGSKAAGAEKGGKDKKQAEKEIGSRPSSQIVLDESRAFWLLRFVADAEVGDEVELKKDTQRQEEIRAMKQAWETAEPGRAVKAMQSRLNYLSNNLVKAGDSDKENDELEEEKAAERTDEITDRIALDESELLFSPPPPTLQKETLKPFDSTPYIKHLLDGAEARYVSAEELAFLDEEEQKVKVEEHNSKRNRNQSFRENDKIERLALKEQQLEACQEMQYEMDRARTELLKPREVYRQRLLEEKRLRDEAAEAAAAAALAASEAATPDGKRGKSGKKKK